VTAKDAEQIRALAVKNHFGVLVVQGLFGKRLMRQRGRPDGQGARRETLGASSVYRALFSAMPPRPVERGAGRGAFALPAA
jgi:hypothetical protein